MATFFPFICEFMHWTFYGPRQTVAFVPAKTSIFRGKCLQFQIVVAGINKKHIKNDNNFSNSYLCKTLDARPVYNARTACVTCVWK